MRHFCWYGIQEKENLPAAHKVGKKRGLECVFVRASFFALILNSDELSMKKDYKLNVFLKKLLTICDRGCKMYIVAKYSMCVEYCRK